MLHCFALWLSGHEKLLVWTSAFAILVFRSELVVLLGLILLQEVFVKQRLTFIKAIGHGLSASALAVGKLGSRSRRRLFIENFIRRSECSGGQLVLAAFIMA